MHSNRVRPGRPHAGQAGRQILARPWPALGQCTCVCNHTLSKMFVIKCHQHHQFAGSYRNKITENKPKSLLLIKDITPSMHRQLPQRNHGIFLTIPKSLLLTSFSIKRTRN